MIKKYRGILILFVFWLVVCLLVFKESEPKKVMAAGRLTLGKKKVDVIVDVAPPKPGVYTIQTGVER